MTRLFMQRLLVLLPLLLASTAAAQDPVFKVQDQNGSVVLLVLEDGTIKLPQGAATGYVLTTDASGNATWQPAPAGGGLTLPFFGTTNSGGLAFHVENTGPGGAGRFTNSNTGIGLVVTSAGGTAISVPSTGNHGLYVGAAGGDGVHITQANQRGVVVESSGQDGVVITRAGTPSQVSGNTGNNGIEINGAEASGLYVGQADVDGVWVRSAGSPSQTINSLAFNGFQVNGAEGNGLFVGQADQIGVVVQSAQAGFFVDAVTLDGLQVNAAGDDGVHITSAGSPSQTINSSANNGVEVRGAAGNGVFIGQADQHGVRIESASNDGISVGSTGEDGVRVQSAGSPSQTMDSALDNGFQVDGAQGNGLFVGHAGTAGVHIESASGNGIVVESAGSNGLVVNNVGSSSAGVDVNDGLIGVNVGGTVFGMTIDNITGTGVQITNTGGPGLFISGTGGTSAMNVTVSAGQPLAASFVGDVQVQGNLTKNSGSFKIDHPLDPAGKYLYHSFVESPDMMNVYNGNAVLDARGEAVVTLPAYFEALNRDFRYQLTCIGGYAPLYVAEKIADNRFKIAGGTPGLEVSWQVTGIRQDAWAEQNRIQVEVDKAPDERGYYLTPEAHGLPETQGIAYRQARQAASPPGDK